MRKKYRYIFYTLEFDCMLQYLLCILFLLPMIPLPLYSSGFTGGTYVCERVMLYFIIIFFFYIHPCSSLPYHILPIIKLLGALKYIIQPLSFQSHNDHA